MILMIKNCDSGKSDGGIKAGTNIFLLIYQFDSFFPQRWAKNILYIHFVS